MEVQRLRLLLRLRGHRLHQRTWSAGFVNETVVCCILRGWCLETRVPEPGPVDETQSEHSESIDLPSRSLGFLACNCSRRSEWIGSGAGDTGFPGRSTADEGMRCRWAGSRQPEQPWEARCLMIRCVETGRFCDKRISQSHVG